jgi:tRNA pseudouridine38-40 synthase
MPRYAIEVIYNGTAFHGSQVQGDTPTVQFSVNSALSTLLRRPIESFGASRTDEGVHALCNFYHFDVKEKLNQHSAYQLNAILPFSVSIRNLYVTSPEFNARFDAISRQYRYRIYKKKNPFLYERAMHYPYMLDRNVLDRTAAMLMEYHDFETFSKRNAQTKTFRCTIMHSAWEEHGEELHYVVEANRFLRGMVRGLVGTQLRAGRGKYDVDEFRRIVESKDCRRADFSPKGFGLYLEKIVYPEAALVLA